tara:strand:- start:430 stop:822 length:393 start_codon:yes stop_codon:yes gene_type:complete
MYAYFNEVMQLSQPKIKSFEELPDYTCYFFSEDYPIDEKVMTKVLKKGEPKARLEELITALPEMDYSTDESIENGIKALAESKEMGFGNYQSIARLALTGTNAGPSITAIIRVLGRERVAARLAKFQASL